jgi:hypothetical protein
MTARWFMGGLTYTCISCGVSAHLTQRELGRMVERRLRKDATIETTLASSESDTGRKFLGETAYVESE